MFLNMRYDSYVYRTIHIGPGLICKLIWLIRPAIIFQNLDLFVFIFNLFIILKIKKNNKK